jgi:hypothetical protein
MKKYTLFIMLLVAHYATAQKCKVKVDPFTGKKSVRNVMTKIGKHKEGVLDTPLFLRCEVDCIDSLYFLTFEPQFLSVRTIKEGAEVLIKFEDSSILSLTVDETSISEFTEGESFTQGTSRTIWYNDLQFTLTKKEIEILKTKRIVLVRCNLFDYGVESNKADVVRNQINCIESHNK